MEFDEDDDDIVDMPRSRAGLPKVLVILGLIMVMFGALVVGARSWYQRQLDPPGPPGEEVTIEIPTGAAPTDLGSLLASADVVSNGTLFRFWVRDKDVELQPGKYVFRRSSSFDEVLEVISSEPQERATLSLTIPEGYRIDQIVDAIVEVVPRFDAEAVRAAIDDPANRSRFLPPEQALPAGVPAMEGMLFPSTYEVLPTDTEATLVRRMVVEMENQASAAGLEDEILASDIPPLSPYQLLIVASLIERETGNPEESAKIARVIYNRMLYGPDYAIFALGIDAVNQYYADVSNTPIDFETPGPYNSRSSLALPPTPIAAPGRASIEAARNPAVDPVSGPLLYYVLETPTQHVFTTTNEEFLEARERCVAAGLC